jgi:hypothetical protein
MNTNDFKAGYFEALPFIIAQQLEQNSDTDRDFLLTLLHNLRQVNE